MIRRITALFITLFCLTFAAVSQIPRLTIITGGNVGMEFQNSSARSDKSNTFSFNFSPMIGGFVTKNFALGINPILSYTFTNGKQYRNDTLVAEYFNSLTAVGFGPFGRYYVKLGPKAYFFTHASVAVLGVWKSNSNNPGSSIKKTVAGSWTAGGGLTYLVTPSVGIELSLLYKGMSYQASDYIGYSQVGPPGETYIEHGMVFNVGVQVYIERKPKKTADVKK